MLAQKAARVQAETPEERQQGFVDCPYPLFMPPSSYQLWGMPIMNAIPQISCE